MRLRYALLIALALPIPAAAQCVTAPAMRRLATPNFAASLNPGGALFRADTLGLRPTGIRESLLQGASVWVTGEAGTQLRVTAPMLQSTGFEVQPGPLSAQGQPLVDCTPFNRVWLVTRADLDAYNASGMLTDDLRDWPAAAGAPVVDGDGVAGNYNLAGGDRPRLIGDVTAWWVMNDQTLARESGGVPVGLEIRTMAYAYNTGSLKDMLFVRYTMVYRPTDGQPLTNARLGMWAAVPSLDGQEYPATDSTLSLSYFYGRNFYLSTSAQSYSYKYAGTGVQMLLHAPTNTAPTGAKYAGYFIPSGLTAGPTNPTHYVRHQSGQWNDGAIWRQNTSGYTTSSYPQAYFIYPAFPGAFWSAENNGSNAITASAIHITAASFTWQPGETRTMTATFPITQTPTSGTHPATTLRILAALAKQATQQLIVANEADARPELAVMLSPNPTRGSLRGTVPSGQPATVALFDALGRQVRTLATLPSGGAFTADVSETTPGVYLVRIEQGTATAWQRLVVMR